MALSGGGISVGNLTAYLGLDDTGFIRGMARATSTMNKVSGTMNRIGQNMTAMITAPLLAIGGASINSAMQFEKAFSEMEGLVGIAKEEVIGFKREIIGMARDTAQGPQQLAEALRFVTSSGFEGGQALEVVKVSAMGAASGLGDVHSLADLVTDAINAYGNSNLSAARAMDILTEAVAQGKGEPKEMATALGYVLPIAKELGVEFDDVAASVAFMTRMGQDSSTAATNLRQMFSDLFDPASQAHKAVKSVGTSFTELRTILREKGTLAALGFLKEQMKGNEVLFGKVFGNVRSLTAALSVTGIQAEIAKQVFGEVATKTGQMNRAFSIAQQTSMFKFNQAMVELKIVGIELGEALLPIFLDLIKVVKNAAHWFTSLSREGQNLVLMGGAIAAAIGPVSLMISGIAGALALITPTVVAVVAGMMALGTAAIYIWHNWEALKERMTNWDWWKNLLIDMLRFLIRYNPMSQFWEAIREGINWLMKLNPALKGIEIPDVFKSVDDQLKDLKTNFDDWEPDHRLTTEFSTLGEAFDAAADKGKELIKVILGVSNKAFGRRGGYGNTPDVEHPEVGRVEMWEPKNDWTKLGNFFPDPKPWDGVIERSAILRKRLMALKDPALAFADAMKYAVVDSILAFGDVIGDAFVAMIEGTAKAADVIRKGVGQIIEMFLRQAIAATISAHAMDPSTGPFPWVKLAAMAAGIIAVKALFAKAAKPQGLASGGYVTTGGVFQVHKDEMVTLPRGSAVTPAHLNKAGSEGGRLSVSISMRQLVIELDKERVRMGRVFSIFG